MDTPRRYYAARNRQAQLVTREDRLDRAVNGNLDRLGWILLAVGVLVAWASVLWMVAH